ncbi:TetR/AcrR family transcriptional regulator [Cohnella nanjingensis]|uniref:TetR/AcrR family transcriptional regulator C-terminal domain-containing protein n=1 Tax=Cohnella nanjingensis TaxID=1387779 RepID=A0A7X0RL03_9BACL|nr:TetR-like C-terminal domain-containing protein [Cohnella nanjingensis]MBB6669432.1 TetR/AcrR family transcriptional regulator C-terminal domain-containing protein [Cohnella nanjingensis]
MDQANPRTDLRIVRTRRMLRDAFVELLEEMEVEKITVNRLAERATINRVTFYLHYRDIPDMMEKMADEMIEDISSIIGSPESQSAASPDVEWPLMVNLLEYIAKHSRFYKVILATKRTTVFTERLLKLLTSLVTERLERSDTESAIAAMGIKRDIAIWYGSSALIGTIITWLRNDMPYTPLFLAKQFALLRHYHQMKS